MNYRSFTQAALKMLINLSSFFLGTPLRKVSPSKLNNLPEEFANSLTLSDKSPLKEGSTDINQEFVMTVDHFATVATEACTMSGRSRRRREVSGAICINHPMRPIIEAALEKAVTATKSFVDRQYKPGDLFSNNDNGEPFDLKKYFLEYHGNYNCILL